MSELNREMLLLFELLPKKNDTDKKKINRTAGGRMFFNMSPRLFHLPTPMNIIENKNGI